jgi:hypothetical protein
VQTGGTRFRETKTGQDSLFVFLKHADRVTLLDQLYGGHAASEQSITAESEVSRRDMWTVLLLTSVSIYDLWIRKN